MLKSERHDRLRGALWGMFVGDALAMPAHWYYDVAALRRDFGTLRDYQITARPPPQLDHAAGQYRPCGARSQQGEVVGRLILHDKKHLWGQANRHYHHGLQAGDNTLNLLCGRVLLRTMGRAGRYDSAAFLREYVHFMTTRGSHNDTYAESYHRAFFANYARGCPPEECVGDTNHDTPSIGGLVTLPPVIVAASADRDPSAVEGTVLTHVRLTHNSAKLERYALAYGRMLPCLLQQCRDDTSRLVYAVAESIEFPLAGLVERMTRATSRRRSHWWHAQPSLLHRPVLPGGALPGSPLPKRLRSGSGCKHKRGW